MLFKHDCDIMAKILYIKMSKQKLRSKINFVQFASIFMGLMDESPDRRNKVIFDILDYNSSGFVNSIYLIQLFKNVPQNTAFGQEIFKIV